MPFTVTVHLPRRVPRSVDVVLDGERAPGRIHSVADLRADLERLLDEPVPGLRVAEAPLADDDVVGYPPLVHGASLVVGGSARPCGAPPPATPATSPVDVLVVSGPDCGHRVPLSSRGLTVGRSATADLVLNDPDLSRTHARLSLTPAGVTLEDLHSTNGVEVDGRLLDDDACAVDTTSRVRLGSSTLRLRGAGRPRVPTTATGRGTLLVHRAPRVRPPEQAVTVEQPAGPAAPLRARTPWVAALAPLPVAVLLAVLFGPQYLLFATTGPLMMIGTSVADRVGARRSGRAEHAAYARLLTERRTLLAAALADEQRRRHHAQPDPAEILAIATGPGRRLWERAREDDDRLVVRVGLGTLPARAGLLAPGARDATHPPLAAVPVCVALGSVGVLGVAGAAQPTLATARAVVGRLAVLSSPLDLRLWVVGALVGADWAWLRWLPHFEGPWDPASAPAALDEMVRARAADGMPQGSWPGTWHVVVADLRDGAPAPPELLAVIERGPAVGVAVVVLAPDPGHLPAGCRAVLEIAERGGSTLAEDGHERVPGVVVDRVGWWWSERLGRALAPLRDEHPRADAPLEPPMEVTLSQLWDGDPFDPEVVRDRWDGAEARDRRPVAVAGASGSGAWRVDLRTDGPHVLVGGTTGSGKSELLQCLVASLALELPPEELAFVLIDYKGGSAFAACAALPHTAGVVTDLDEHLTARALASLRAELTRREQILALVGARDVEDYRRRRRPGDPPLGRLVVVIDEFRLLAVDLPEFIAGIVHLAAVGRSLGVHLVLATQRPAGVVTADIQANVNLRIALRVRDRADSLDVIESPDAAAIPAHRVGRGLARTGGGSLTVFQAAHVSGPAPARTPGPVLRLAGPAAPSPATAASASAPAPEDNELARIVEAVRAAAAARGAPEPHCPWRPPLPATVALAALDTDGPAGTSGPPPVGLADLPGQQRQDPLRWDPSRGHWLLAGGPRSGRTTAALTIALSAAHAWGPDDIHVYAVDGSGALGPLSGLPHTGTVVGLDEPGRAVRLVSRLRDEVRRRAAAVATAGAADVAEWQARARTAAVATDAPPPILLLVDGWDRIAAASDPLDGGLAGQLLALLREGAGGGLAAVVTGDRSLLTGRLAPLAGAIFALRPTDPVDAALVGLSRADLPHDPPPGRAVRAGDGVEIQFAHPGATPDSASLRSSVEAVARRWAHRGCGRPHTLVRVRPLPPVALRSAIDRAPPWCLGLGGDEAVPVSLDPAAVGRRLLVAGPPGSGRSTALATVGTAALTAGHPLCVVGPGPPTLAAYLRRAPGAVVAHATAYDIDALVAARRDHPDLAVLVDDAEGLLDTPVEPVLREIARLVDRDGGLIVVATTPAAVLTQVRGLVVEVARRQRGILLCPQGAGDAAVFGIAVPRGAARVPGRGLLVAGRAGIEVQVAMPDSWLTAG